MPVQVFEAEHPVFVLHSEVDGEPGGLEEVEEMRQQEVSECQGPAAGRLTGEVQHARAEPVSGGLPVREP